MADDIDIEEHDILDHPKIQNIFPDLSLVKNEVVDQEDDFPYQDYAEFNSAVAIKMEPGTSYCDEPDPIRPTKIILGSRPNPTPMYDPSPQLTLEDLGNPDIDAFVVIEDIGPELVRSNCFCKKCETLFPTVNVLDAHNMTAHSYLVAVERPNRAIKSTAKKQGAKINLTYCNHCNTNFPDTDSLIKHMYNVMTSKSEEALEYKIDQKTPQPAIKPSEPDHLMYRCRVCKCFFGKLSYFTNHLQCNHRITIEDRDLHKVPFNKRCFFCPEQYSSARSYKQHIGKSHSKIFYCHESQSSKTPKVVHKTIAKTMQAIATTLKTANNPFKCLLCNMEIKYVLFHKNKFHPDLKLSDVPIKKLNNAGKLPLSLYKSRPSKCKYELTQVPASYLFKCPKCDLHFLAAYVCAQHSNSCQLYKTNNTVKFQCSVVGCQKMFRQCDAIVHEIQHKLNSSFQVITIFSNVRRYLLNKCAKCEALLLSMDFAPHMAECDGTSSTDVCDYCDLPMHTKSIRIHSQQHELYKLDRKKFKIIEYKLVSDIENGPSSVKQEVKSKIVKAPSLKRKLSSEEDFETKPKQAKQAKLSSVYLYVCDHCECAMPSLKTKKMHQKQLCLQWKPIICKYCGLLLTSRSAELHYTLHTKSRLTIKDFSFLNLFTGKPMAVPITKLPLCESCDVHFGTFLSYHQHKCERRVKYHVCIHCDIKIEARAYSIHMSLHDSNMKKSKVKIEVPSEEVNMKEEKIVEKMPELLKKYQSLQSTWNILYICQSCEIVTDSYDVVVEHSQRHFAGMEGCDIILQKKCRICKLSFPANCYTRHVELHKNTKLRRHSFNMLRYDYRNLLSPAWSRLFDGFSDDLVKQIVSKSMYEHVRNVKLEVHIQGAKDETLYKCAQCTSAVLPENIRKHVEQPCMKPKLQLHQLLLKCKTCDISFSSQKMYVQHCIYHARYPEPLRVLLFNKPEDVVFNWALAETAMKKFPQDGGKSHSESKALVNPLSKKSKKYNKNDKRDNIFRFYRCIKCGSCLSDKNKLHFHKCNRHLTKCTQCGLQIHGKYYGVHLTFHKTNPKFTRSNFRVTDISVSNGKLKVHGLRSLPPVPNASASLPVDKIKKRFHKKLLHKCTTCDVCFLTYKALWNHARSEQKRRPPVTCEQCGIKFGSIASLQRHKEIHHTLYQLTFEDFVFRNRDDFCWKPITKQKLTDVKTVVPTKKMVAYRCYMCSVLFDSIRSLECHMRKSLDVHHLVHKPCSYCGLVFSKKCRKDHYELHRKYQLTAADFIVKTNLLYQCSECKTTFHFYSSFKSHVEKKLCSDSIEKQKCAGCDNVFVKDELTKHVALFHTILNLKVDDVTLIDKIDKEETFDTTAYDHLLRGEIKKPKDIDRNFTFRKPTDGSLASVNVKLPIVDDQKETIEKLPDADPSVKVTLYKCYECLLHFVSAEDVKVHFASKRKYNISPKTCLRCGFKFTSDSIFEHNKIHHMQMGLKKENFIVQEMYILYNCKECDIYFPHVRTLQYHVYNGHAVAAKVECTFCGLNFSTMSIKKHVQCFHTDINVKKEEFTIDVNRNDSGKITDYFRIKQSIEKNINVDETCSSHGKRTSIKTENNSDDEILSNIKKEDITDDGKSSDSGIITPEKPKLNPENSLMDTSDVSSKENTSVSGSSPSYANFKLKLYKCSSCNVFFLAQNTCYKHVRKHEPMDPKEFIECKLCNLQFPFMTLHVHMKRHHIQKTYEPKDILIEEYFPGVDNNAPTINIYYLIEKLQSELVTTTSEIVKDSRLSIESDKDVSKTVQIKTEPLDSLEYESLNAINPSPKVYKRISKDNNDAQNHCENKLKADGENAAVKIEITPNETDMSNSVVDSKEVEFPCDLCEEQFKSKIALELHVNLDHIDAPVNCRICSESYSKSILNTIHLGINSDSFKCCVCKDTFKVDELDSHAESHR